MEINMNEETLEKMTSLRLRGMYNAFKTSLETSQREIMTIDQFISWLVISEWDDRRNRAIERAIKQANFRHKSSIEELNFSQERGLDKNQVQRLADLSFIHSHKDVFITGSQVQVKLIWRQLWVMKLVREDKSTLLEYSPIDGTT